MILDISDLGATERQIMIDTLARLRKGVHVYGAWNPKSKATWLSDAVEEALDTNAYLLAELYRLRQVTLMDEDVEGMAV